MAISVLELARYRGAMTALDGSTSGAELERVALLVLGDCEVCGAGIAARNAYLSTAGFLYCGDCIGDDGWISVPDAYSAIFGDSRLR